MTGILFRVRLGLLCPRRRGGRALSDTAIRPSVCPGLGRAASLTHRHAGCLQLSHVRTADLSADGRIDPPRVELPSAGAYRLYLFTPNPDQGQISGGGKCPVTQQAGRRVRCVPHWPCVACHARHVCRRSGSRNTSTRTPCAHCCFRSRDNTGSRAFSALPRRTVYATDGRPSVCLSVPHTHPFNGPLSATARVSR